MTRLFRSKSCGLVSRTEFNPAPPPAPFFQDVNKDKDDDKEEEEEEEEEEEVESDDDDDDDSSNPVSTLFINPGSKADNQVRHSQHQFGILDIVVAALKKSLVTCSVEREDVSSLDISWPTEVRHVSHVTFDRFNGFLGLPSELQPEVPTRVPSAR